MPKLVILAAALFSAFFVIFSCSNLFDNINVDSPVSSETVTLTGIVSTSGRMALPSGTFAATRYTVSATASGAEPVTGSVNDSNKTFSIGLKLGKKWTITLVMEASESTEPTPPDSSFKEVFEGTYAFDHDLTVDDVTTPLNIVLVPLSTGSGKINLPISVDSNVSASTVVISGLSASLETYTLSGGSYTISKISVPCGAYTVPIDFKNSAGMLVYSTTQTINVFPNMTTDRWVSSGSSGPISSDGTFLVTSALVQAFAQTQIYVGANPYQRHEPADTNLGTPYAPLATFAAALTRITDSSKDYTIHISGTQQNFTYSITSDFDSKMKSLTLCGMTGNTTDILYGPASGTVLVIATTKPVTIKNLKITNGNAGYKGGGIQMSAGTDVTLGTGALITGNRAFQKGGGVYVEGTSSSKAKLTIENGAEISANTLTDSNMNNGGFGLYADYAIISMTGGSICDHDGTGFTNANNAPRGTVRLKNTQFTMTGGKITGNKVMKIGGNLFVDANTQFTIDGGEISYGTIENDSDDSCGAGMWIQGENSSNKGTVTFKSGKIIGNVATSANPSAGGGVFIYNYGRFIVEGGEISGNSAVKGGAVFVATSGEFKIKGSASIPAGVNGSTGVGKNDVYLDTDAKITVVGALTGTSPVAALTLAEPSNGLTVLEKDSGVTSADFAAACGKFAVNSTEYTIGSDGKLHAPASALPSSSDDIVSGNTYTVADSSAMEKLAEFSSEGCDFSGVTLQLDADITIDTEWSPIGDGTSFNGTFDGNEKTVTFAPETNAEAFFGTVGGTVKNLKVAGSTSVAGIAKTASSSAVIENCESSATIIGSTDQEYCAGIVALVESNAKIKDCVNTGSITCNCVLPADNYTYGAGGITGNVVSGGIIDSCINTGNVTGPNAGGITAHIDSTNSEIRNAYNSGNITSTGLHAGGIAAVTQGSNAGTNYASHVFNCFNSGSVSAEGTEYSVYAGGIVGKLGWGNTSWAQNCLNIGNVSLSESAKSGSYAGALFGFEDGWSQIDFCYYKEGCAVSGLGAGNVSPDAENQCVKATQSGTNNAVISVDVTFDGNNYYAGTGTVLSLLNAWVTANSTNGMYLEWEAGEDNWPRLKTE